MLYEEDLDRYDNPDWSLALMLGVHKEYWQEIYNDYWGLADEAGPEHLDWGQWERGKHLDRIAQRLTAAALSLDLRQMANADELPAVDAETLGVVRNILVAYGESVLVRDRFSFEPADDALNMLYNAPDRLRQLISLTLSGTLDQRTTAFLSRIGRLYVYGFEPETLILCRAALDTALQERFPDSNVEKVLGMSRERGYTLQERIHVAYSVGVFDDVQRSSAHRLRRAGNDAVHVAPGFLVEGVADAFAAIVMLSDLLVALFHPATEES
jgi:hypothetical protein